jgi:hypothetical protein
MREETSHMIVIIARPHDNAAAALTRHWSRHDARLMNCNDLSRAGWRYSLGGSNQGVAVAGGQTIACGAIVGVLTRLASVSPEDLVHVVAEDRAYVAEEMTAFLRGWLAGLTARVVNRPSPSCLAGPGWGPERWAKAAAGIGLPVVPVWRRAVLSPAETSLEAKPDCVDVTVVGDRCFGAGVEELAGPARRLAASAGLDLLTVRFNGRSPGAAFVGANPWPDIASPNVARAVAALFVGGTSS